MSRQGTWCDNLVIQAVSNAPNCIIHITESAAYFAQTTIKHPINIVGKARTIYLGHIDEAHYVSTVPVESEVSNVHSEQSYDVEMNAGPIHFGDSVCDCHFSRQMLHIHCC